MARYSINGTQGRRLLEGLYTTNDLNEAIKKCQIVAERFEVDTLAVYDNEIEDTVKTYTVKYDR